MLEVSARFHKSSTNHQLVIYLQCSDATRVCRYCAWQRFGRQVRKGERRIQILAPCRKRVSPVESEHEEDVERVEIPAGFRVVHLFDVSQTDGAELEAAPRPAQVRSRSNSSSRWSGSSPTRASCCGSRQSHGRRATVTRLRAAPGGDGRGPFRAQTAKTLIHELAHLLLHRDGDLCDRAVAEVEAGSVAFVVPSALGLDTSDYRVPLRRPLGGGLQSSWPRPLNQRMAIHIYFPAPYDGRHSAPIRSHCPLRPRIYS